MIKVELFEIIRKEHFVQGKSIREIARQRNIHRRQVRQAVKNAVPPKRKINARHRLVLTPPLQEFIIQLVKKDQDEPRKQRHTGQRVYDRLCEEFSFQGSVVTVRQFFYKQRKQLGINNKAFVPQVHAAGDEAEVDWYEAQVNFPDGRRKIYFFQMRACHSGYEFHMAFERQNQQSFLEAHVAAFEYFGGIFKHIRYDNLSSAVKKVLRGRKRLETERFIALRSHYLFESIFCLPGVEGAHEKGGVEGGVGRFRRSHLVPVPTVTSIFVLNKQLLAACAQDAKRIISGKDTPVEQRWQNEMGLLSPLPNERFDTAEVCTPQVNKKSLATIKGNYYSAPVSYVGQLVEARVHAQHVDIYKQGKRIAHHERCYQQHKTIAELAHYLALLKHKPGALAGSQALLQAREKNQWPARYDQYWGALLERHDKNEANRLFVDFLWWARDIEVNSIEWVLTEVLKNGCYQLDALRLLLRRHLQTPNEAPPLSPETLGELSRYERPMGSIEQYDTLLTQEKIS